VKTERTTRTIALQNKKNDKLNNSILSGFLPLKDLILISESILCQDQIPGDLLDSQRFDLLRIQESKEKAFAIWMGY